MQPTAISALVAELSADIAAASRRIEVLKHEVDEQTAMLAKMWTARQALTDLLPEQEVVTEPDALPAMPAAEEEPAPDADDPTEESSASSGSAGFFINMGGPKRIRSTPMVTQVVDEGGRPMTRDEIREEFDRRGWTPQSWSNPDNAIGNAMGRAVDQGLIQRMVDGRVAPLDYGTPSFTSDDIRMSERSG